MADSEQLAILRTGVSAWNTWRRNNSAARPDLTGADLRQADLRAVDFHGADLRGADLRGADLRVAGRSANLSHADLREARLCGANLRRANLGAADLRKANLAEATLHRALLEMSKLDGAVLDKANLGGAHLRRAVIRGASLRAAVLSGADLTLCDLRGAILKEAKLVWADLRGASLARARMEAADLRRACLIEADLCRSRLNEANLEGADLTRAVLVQASLDGANISRCRVYGTSAWGLSLGGTRQRDLIITSRYEPEISVDNIEVAQFIYLLLRNDKIRDTIDAITMKVVLILGRFTPDRKAILDAIREALRLHGYVPILFDFVRPATRDFTETVRTLGHLARFIVADITDPRSVPQELQAIVPDLQVAVQPLLLQGASEWGMFADLRKYDWVLPVHVYKDLDDLLSSLERMVIVPAEAKAEECAAKRSLPWPAARK